MAANAIAADESGALEDQADASWEHFPTYQRSAATENVNIYLDDFISVVQGGPRDRRQVLWHLFHQNYGLSDTTRRRTPTVNTAYTERSLGKDMRSCPHRRQSSGRTSTRSPTCFPFPIDDKRIFWPHWRPSPGRRTLRHCENGASSWGCCAASPRLLPDRGACSHGCNMTSKERQVDMSNSKRKCTTSSRPGANYSAA